LALLTESSAFVPQAILDLITTITGLDSFPASNAELPYVSDFIEAAGVTIDLNGVSVASWEEFKDRDEFNTPFLLVDLRVDVPVSERDGEYGGPLSPAHFQKIQVYLVMKREAGSETRGLIASNPDLLALELCGAIRAQVNNSANWKNLGGSTTFLTRSEFPTLVNALEEHFMGTDKKYIAASFEMLLGIIEDLTA